MKIKSLKLHPVAVKRQYGTVIASEDGKPKRTVRKSFLLFLELFTDNGLTGWGEVSDIEPKDLPADVTEYAELLSAFTVGRSPFEIHRLHHEFREYFGVENNSLAGYTECALDMAMYDIQGKAVGRPVCDLFGGALRKEIVVSWVAYIREDVDLIRDEIREKCRQDFLAFKLKVGVDIDLDEQRLALARETAGKEASIKVDANEGWSVEDAPKNIRRLNKYNLAGIETPVPCENPADIATVRRQVAVPILEHVHDPAYGRELLKADAVDAFNISTPSSGGIWPARMIVALAEAADIGVLVGSTVELGLGTLAQLHFAATVRNLTLPSDLIGPGMYQNDVLRQRLGYTQRGMLNVPNVPGLGGEIDRERMQALVF